MKQILDHICSDCHRETQVSELSGPGEMLVNNHLLASDCVCHSGWLSNACVLSVNLLCNRVPPKEVLSLCAMGVRFGLKTCHVDRVMRNNRDESVIL